MFRKAAWRRLGILRSLENGGRKPCLPQIKTRLTSSLEANAAAGQDNGFSHELRSANPLPNAGVYSGLVRNRTFLGNLIYRPRAYLLLSAEYRNIHTWQIVGPASQANVVGLAAGYLF